MRQAEPSELGQVLNRHNGQISAGGWLLYFGLIFAGGSVTAAADAKWEAAAVAFCIAALLLFICWRRWNQSATVCEGGIVWRRGRQRKVVIVDVSWGADGDTLTISWTEHEGPPVSPPRRRGFGSVVMKEMVERAVGGKVDLQFARSGVIWRLTCPATNALEHWEAVAR